MISTNVSHDNEDENNDNKCLVCKVIINLGTRLGQTLCYNILVCLLSNIHIQLTTTAKNMKKGKFLPKVIPCEATSGMWGIAFFSARTISTPPINFTGYSCSIQRKREEHKILNYS